MSKDLSAFSRFGEIQGCEFSVVFLCGVVVGLCGVDFIFVVAQKYGLAVGHDSDAPSTFALVPCQALVL